MAEWVEVFRGAVPLAHEVFLHTINVAAKARRTLRVSTEGNVTVLEMRVPIPKSLAAARSATPTETPE